MQEIVSSSGEIMEYQQVTTDMVQNFIEFIDASENTVKTYSRGVKKLLEYLLTNNIKQPRREDIIAFREELKTSHKATTVQNYMVAIKLFFKWTNSVGVYPNIAENLKGAKISREHKKDYLTSSQVKRVLGEIDTSTLQGKRDYAMVALMITGGLRDTEVANADIQDLRTVGDFTVLYVLGKGRQEKSDYIKIVENVENAIRDYLKERKPLKQTEPLFASVSNHNNSGRLTTRSISRICKKALLAAGYDSDRLTAHSLRHTAVTLSLLGGMTLQEAQEFARHRNIATTQIYAHNLDRLKNQCEETIAKAIF